MDPGEPIDFAQSGDKESRKHENAKGGKKETM